MGEILGVQNIGLGMKAYARNEREIILGSFVSTWNERGEIRFGSYWNEPRSWIRVFKLGSVVNGWSERRMNRKRKEFRLMKLDLE